MFVSRVVLKNWRNFRNVDIRLRERTFLVGPNASGKSNFLDVFRFLRDIANREGGGLQKAVRDRGGISKLRCLAARRDPEIGIRVELNRAIEEEPLWVYELAIKQETRGRRQPYLSYERAWHEGSQVLDRPNKNDNEDFLRRTQTILEQIIGNEAIRPIVRYLDSITYLHLVPQLLRYADAFQGFGIEEDPFGQGFLERVASTTERTRTSRLKKIEKALQIAVPQLERLQFKKDETTGRPHLHALYSHWRPNAGWQREDEFSDGTLRMLGLLWSLLEGDSLLLLEEPELSLHSAVVRQLAPLIWRMQKQRRRQVLVSTHSSDLLNDPGIGGNEVLVVTPDVEGSTIEVASSTEEIEALLDSGLTVADVVLDKTKPKRLDQLSSFE